jgi:hypothetical protein
VKSRIKQVSIHPHVLGLSPSTRRHAGNPSYLSGTPSADSSIDLVGIAYRNTVILTVGKPRRPTGLDAQTAIAKVSSKPNFNRSKADVQEFFIVFHFFVRKW